MNRKIHGRVSHTPNPLTSPLPTQHNLTENTNPCSSFSRTNRKQSLNPNRTALIEINQNHSRPSNSKASAPRLSSTQTNRPTYSSSQITASKWLDSEKEMMEFILSLKGRQTASRVGSNEGFEVGEERQERISNRMLVLRKVEKYEKDAINSFYEKDHERSLFQLQKAETLLQKQRVDSLEHSLYIQYLYSEFYFKLEKIDKWRVHLERATQLASKVPEKDLSQMKEYLLNIKVLGICLLQHDQQYEKANQAIKELPGSPFSSKIRRRIHNTHIAVYRGLSQWGNALSLIQEELQALEHDRQLNEEKRQQEIATMISLKVEVTAESGNIDRALKMVETLIGFKETADGDRDSFAFYHYRVYNAYYKILQQEQSMALKRLFFTEKWVEVEPSRKEKLRLELSLFEQCYGLGLYERALELFDQISCENIVYLGPKYLGMLASIKQFQGEEKEALGIYLKLVEMTTQVEKKATFAYRILELELDEQGPTFRSQREKVLEALLKTGGYNSIVQLYVEYLSRRGEKERSGVWAGRVRKTATFADESSLPF